jgi:hypothetical protein
MFTGGAAFGCAAPSAPFFGEASDRHRTMTHSTAERLANVVMATAAVGAAYYVLKTPSLRRIAWRLAVAGLTGTLPAWFRQEVSEGWKQSGQTANGRS